MWKLILLWHSTTISDLQSWHLSFYDTVQQYLTYRVDTYPFMTQYNIWLDTYPFMTQYNTWLDTYPFMTQYNIWLTVDIDPFMTQYNNTWLTVDTYPFMTQYNIICLTELTLILLWHNTTIPDLTLILLWHNTIPDLQLTLILLWHSITISDLQVDKYPFMTQYHNIWLTELTNILLSHSTTISDLTLILSWHISTISDLHSWHWSFYDTVPQYLTYRVEISSLSWWNTSHDLHNETFPLCSGGQQNTWLTMLTDILFVVEDNKTHDLQC